MHVMRHDRVVVNAIAFLQHEGAFPVFNLDDAFQHVNKLLALVRGGNEILTLLGGGDLDQERLHVASRLILREGMIIHVLVAVHIVVGKPDTIALIVFLTADDRPQFRLVVQERS